jgi:hypothetical protein
LENTYYTHQYLNQTAYDYDQRVSTNKTTTWYSSTQKDIIGPDFTAIETSSS